MGPTSPNSVPYGPDFWAKVRDMRARGVPEDDILRYLQANMLADQDRRQFLGQTSPYDPGLGPGQRWAPGIGRVYDPSGGPLTAPPKKVRRRNPDGQPAPTMYDFAGNQYNYLGLSHLNLNPEAGYQAYADYTLQNAPGGQNSPFAAYLRGQFGQEQNRYQVQAAQNPGLKWTDYLTSLGNDPMHRFRNLAPKVRGVEPVGRALYGY